MTLTFQRSHVGELHNYSKDAAVFTAYRGMTDYSINLNIKRASSLPPKNTFSLLCTHIYLPVGWDFFYSGNSGYFCDFIYVPLNHLNLIEPQKSQEWRTFQWLFFHHGYNQSTFQRDTWEIPRSLHYGPPSPSLKWSITHTFHAKGGLASSASSLSKPVLVWTCICINQQNLSDMFWESFQNRLLPLVFCLRHS